MLHTLMWKFLLGYYTCVIIQYFFAFWRNTFECTFVLIKMSYSVEMIKFNLNLSQRKTVFRKAKIYSLKQRPLTKILSS